MGEWVEVLPLYSKLLKAHGRIDLQSVRCDALLPT